MSTLAQEWLERLGVWARPEQTYSQDEALRVLQGRPVDPVVADVIHDKLSWVTGVQVLGHLRRTEPGLGSWLDRIEIRTLRDSESSASCKTFPDGSQVIVVSRALQESVITMANAVVYFDVATAVARVAWRRRKRDERVRDEIARVLAILRCLLIVQRTTGRAPLVSTQLDDRSTMVAGQMAAGAMMFILAHELGHLVHGHGGPSAPQVGTITDPQTRELQVDFWSLGYLRELLKDDATQTDSLWSAFIALFAMHMTEEALTVRRSRTHPEAWARWATMDKMMERQTESRVEAMRAGVMAAIGGAMQLDEALPENLWAPIWQDERLRMPKELTQEVLSTWDRLQTCPLAALLDEAERASTVNGQALLATLRGGDVRAALTPLITPTRLGWILDPQLGLSYPTLAEIMSKAAPSLTNGDPATFTVAGARLAAAQLKKVA